ncbi:MAG: sigma-70 family RNA polymerase sigma factor [Planctomycetes bacterium]|nr:sigma-70 family RNA polymerase sigma factor [Planctomycetota bacterium]MBI3846874.1 sigma-70 family RNA polymerase sigma factor [Planctomycetota bacterium]
MCDIARLKAGDDAEWKRLQDRYLRRVYFYVQKSVKDPDTCDDIVQEVFLGAIRGIDRFDEAYNIEQFLFGIARNKVVDHFRRDRPDEAVGTTGDDDDKRRFRAIENLAHPTESPSRLAVGRESAERERAVLTNILRKLVERYWKKGEFHKLKAVELIFVRNEPYSEIVRLVPGIRDERAIAGIKFNAIAELQKLAKQEDPNRSLFSELWR